VSKTKDTAMTKALCLNCGHTKFGAITPCPECNVASTGDMNLDVTFSEHRISISTISELGKVIQDIRRVCKNDKLRFKSFIRYVSLNHPSILSLEQPPDERAECDDVLDKAIFVASQFNSNDPRAIFAAHNYDEGKTLYMEIIYNRHKRMKEDILDQSLHESIEESSTTQSDPLQEKLFDDRQQQPKQRPWWRFWDWRSCN